MPNKLFESRLLYDEHLLRSVIKLESLVVKTYEYCRKIIQFNSQFKIAHPKFDSNYYKIQNKLWWFSSKDNSIQGSEIHWYRLNQKCAKKCPKRQKIGLFIRNWKYRFNIWFIHHFMIKFTSKDYSISIFPGIFNSKDYSITFSPENSIQK